MSNEEKSQAELDQAWRELEETTAQINQQCGELSGRFLDEWRQAIVQDNWAPETYHIGGDGQRYIVNGPHRFRVYPMGGTCDSAGLIDVCPCDYCGAFRALVSLQLDGQHEGCVETPWEFYICPTCFIALPDDQSITTALRNFARTAIQCFRRDGNGTARARLL